MIEWIKRLWDKYRDAANENSFNWRGEHVRPFPDRWRETQAAKEKAKAEREAGFNRLRDFIHAQHTMDKPPSRFA